MGGIEMKKLVCIAAATLPLLSVSCQKQELVENIGTETGIYTVRAFLDEESAGTRTSMSPNEGGSTYSVLWDADDAISLNGIPSETITVDEADARQASFTFLQSFEAPLNAVYPASAASSYSAGTYSIALPVVQTYDGPDQFDAGSAVMLAHSMEDGTLTFRHAMAYLRVTLVAAKDTDNIATVILSSNGKEALSGQFNAVYASDRWTLEPASEGNGSSVELSCGETGAAIGDKMVIAIPAGTYASGLELLLMDVNGDYQIKTATNSFTAAQGGIYDMEFAFEPDGKSTENDIFSVEDWTTFAKAVAGGNTFEGQTINLMADLTVPEYFEYGNGVFEGTFEGNGKTMTANANQWPLFAEIGANGAVRNLNVAGKFARFANAGSAGNAVIAKINRGTISDCVNYADAEVSTTGSTVFGAIAAQNGGIIERCANYGDIAVTQNAASATAAGFYGGGISAIGHTVLGSQELTKLDIDETCTAGTFIDCENHGNITAVATGQAATKCAYGGICGLVYMNGVKFSGCRNYGDVSRISNGEESSQASGSVGGILGRSAGWFITDQGSTLPIDNGDVNGFDTVYENCMNEGALHIECMHSGGIKANVSAARLDAAGGIVGAAIGKDANVQKFTDCTNTGDVTGGWTTDVNTASLGGLAGLATDAEFSGCTVNCAVKSLDKTYNIGAAGGVAGFVRSDVTVTGCTVSAAIDAYTYPEKPLFTGLVFGNVVTSASVTDTNVSGSISEDGTDFGITAENYVGFICDGASNAQPSTSNVTYAE